MNFLLEIGTEELPPQIGLRLSFDLRTALHAALQRDGIAIEDASSRCFSTPRRIAILWDSLPAASADQAKTVRGPAQDKAYDDKGAPTAALKGFCQRYDTTPEQLQTDTSGRLVLQHNVPGKSIGELLAAHLPKAVGSLSMGRTMRWGDGKHRFIRPVRWILALLDDEILEVELFGLQAGRLSYGHRIYAPNPITIPHCNEWEYLLRKKRVVPDVGRRRERIVQAATTLAAQKGGELDYSPSLLDEITDLVEWPRPLLCEYDSLDLPDAIIRAVLEKHQRCLPIKGKNGNLLPYFIAVPNLMSRDPEAVRIGNERVVRPRLEDAAFFYRQDKKISIDDYAKRLENLAFYRGLGSMADKSERLVHLTAALYREMTQNNGEAIQPNVQKTLAYAARYCKIDQTSLMVQEFPGLEGIMAGDYLQADANIPKHIGPIVAEHYKPLSGYDDLPKRMEVRLLGLADRLDSLVGFLAAGAKISPDRDPLGLRRLALAICHLTVIDKLDIPVQTLVQLAAEIHLQQAKTRSADGIPSKGINLSEAIQGQAEEFIWGRFTAWRGNFVPDSKRLLAACRPVAHSLADCHKRMLVLEEWVDKGRTIKAIEAFRRCHNLLHKAGEDIATTQLPDLPELATNAEAADRSLYLALQRSGAKVQRSVELGKYDRALDVIHKLAPTLESFFDGVMVMAEEAKLRKMRLGMLRHYLGLCNEIADFSKLY